MKRWLKSYIFNIYRERDRERKREQYRVFMIVYFHAQYQNFKRIQWQYFKRKLEETFLSPSWNQLFQVRLKKCFDKKHYLSWLTTHTNTRFEETSNLRKIFFPLLQRSKTYLSFHWSLWSQIITLPCKGEPLGMSLKNLGVKSIKNDNGQLI